MAAHLGIEAGGNYITPEYSYRAVSLGFKNEDRVQVFYIEAMKGTGNGRVVTRMVLEY